VIPLGESRNDPPPRICLITKPVNEDQARCARRAGFVQKNRVARTRQRHVAGEGAERRRNSHAWHDRRSTGQNQVPTRVSENDYKILSNTVLRFCGIFWHEKECTENRRTLPGGDASAFGRLYDATDYRLSAVIRASLHRASANSWRHQFCDSDEAAEKTGDSGDSQPQGSHIRQTVGDVFAQLAGPGSPAGAARNTVLHSPPACFGACIRPAGTCIASQPSGRFQGFLRQGHLKTSGLASRSPVPDPPFASPRVG
jgi:hypothetical protein